MSPEIHQRVRQLFDEALLRPEAERAPFLQTACAGNAEVCGQVTQLLEAHAEAGHFLESERALPQRIGRYMITGELGRGAMGIVYKAIDPLIGRDVAVKVIRLQALADGGEAAFLRERLFREARAAGGLFHPGIIVILDVGQEGDLPFIAMEYVEGPSLFQVLAARPKIDCGEALKILHKTAAALDFAHGKGVVHRDIKPANILLENGVIVKVADFGIAKIASSQRYTKTGMRMGTPSYMSPEQVDAKPLDERSDQFSLAVVAYELLTGAQPFRAEPFTALAHMIVYGPRPSARAANPELPASIDQVFYRGLGKLPGERYANCREFVTALERALTGQVSGGEAGETPAVRGRTGRPSRYILGGAVAAVLLVSTGVGYKRLNSAPAAVPTATPALDRQTVPSPLPPVIAQFLADPPTIEPGAEAILSWKVSGATKVDIDPNIGKKPTAGHVQVKPSGPTYYVLTATNAAGTVFQEAFVEVRRSAVSLYLEGKSKLRTHFAEALDLLRQAGELGETHAMMVLGNIYWERGESRDDKDEFPEAFRWFHKAADAGDRDGMRNVGVFYEMGIGVRENELFAAQWYRKAVDLGSSDAAYNLGGMYEAGRGVPRDLGKAHELRQLAVELATQTPSPDRRPLSRSRRQTN
jgi:hypothetical protein